MEYLFCSKRSIDTAHAERIFNTNRISYRRAFPPVFLGTHLLVCNSETVEEGDYTRAFMGSAFGAGMFANNFTPRTKTESLRLASAIENSPEGVTGTFTQLRHTKSTGRTDFFFDDLNAGPCFYARHAGEFAVSCNIHMLADWLRAQGVEPTRSIDPFISEAAFGCGLLKDMLYKEIQLIQPEQRPRAGVTLEIVTHDPVWPGLMTASYEDLIHSAANRIAQRMEILSNMGDRAMLILDVTGGMDSRILFAALAGVGNLENWHFNTLFAHPNPDGNFAQFVGEKFGIPQVKMANSRKPSLPDGMKEFRLQLFHSMGTENKRGYSPNIVNDKIIRVHGGFGELAGKCQDTKRFYGNTAETTTPEALQNNYLAAVRKSTIDNGFSQNFENWATDVLGRVVPGILAEGHEMTAMPALFYRRGKSRSHYGYISHLRALRSLYPDVLNDPYLTAAAIKIGPRISLFGKVNFDLIRLLGGDEIAALPLVLTRWQRGMFDNEEDFRKFSKPQLNASSAALFTKNCPIINGPENREYPLILPSSKANVPNKAISQTFPRKKKIEETRNLINAVREYGPVDPEIHQYLPEKVIKTFLEADIESLEPSVANLTLVNFYSAADMWLKKEELPYYANEDLSVPQASL